ncbi:MAG TPA: hypothetical protein VMB18_08625 [Terriglobales bacterium]|nr:hypothetical protein [Terriglobales bacterium]
MNSRLVAFTLALSLSLAVGCTKKTDQNANQTADQTAASNANTPAPAAAPAPPPAPLKPKIVTITVPSGTVLTVRLGQQLGSKISQPGQTFAASLANDLAVDGKTVIPAGANASGTVVDAKPLGKIKGAAVLELQLTSISVNGSDQAIQTAAVTRSEKGKGKRTAVGAGGGAALGGIIGGLAGGGKGAVIGLLAGGGAGTAGAAFTGNKEIVLPAESALSFTLSQPLTFQREVKP